MAKQPDKVLSGLYKGLDKLNDAHRVKVEKELAKMYRESLKQIQADIASIYAKHGKNVSIADMNKFNRLKSLEKQIAKEIKLLAGESIKLMSASIGNVYAQNYYYTGYASEVSAGVEMAYQRLQTSAIRASMVSPYDAFNWRPTMKDHYNELFNKVKKDITRGLIQGSGFEETARAVKKNMGITGGQAMRIVHTESTRAQTQGVLAGFDTAQTDGAAVGIEVKLRWVATLDTKTRSNHQILDTQFANEDGFWTDPFRTEGPGLSGIAGEDINCRCAAVESLVDYPPEERRDNLASQSDAFINGINGISKMTPFQGFEAWKEMRL